MAIERWESANKAFEDGSIESCDDATLRAHLLALSNQQIYNDSIQHRDVIRGLTLNHILLQRHIGRLDRQNTRTQRWVIALAVASLIGTAAQVFCGYTYGASGRGSKDVVLTIHSSRTRFVRWFKCVAAPLQPLTG